VDRRLEALLRDESIMRPRSAFRAELRDRLLAAPPAASGLSASPAASVLLGLCAVVGGLAVLVAVVRPSVERAGVVPVPTAAALPATPAGSLAGIQPAAATVAATHGAVGTIAATGVVPGAPPTAGHAGGAGVVVASGSPVPSVVAGPVAVIAKTPAPQGGSSEPHEIEPSAVPPSPTLEDAPEQTPVPLPTRPSPSPAPPSATATPLGGLPPTPTAAPTGEGWPTLEPPRTPTPVGGS
jgi:hypothetical protein